MYAGFCKQQVKKVEKGITHTDMFLLSPDKHDATFRCVVVVYHVVIVAIGRCTVLRLLCMCRPVKMVIYTYRQISLKGYF